MTGPGHEYSQSYHSAAATKDRMIATMTSLTQSGYRVFGAKFSARPLK